MDGSRSVLKPISSPIQFIGVGVAPTLPPEFMERNKKFRRAIHHMHINFLSHHLVVTYLFPRVAFFDKMANLDVEIREDKKQSHFPAAQFECNCQWY